MTPRRRRTLMVTAVLAGVSVAVFFALAAFQKNLLYFFTPSQVRAGEAPTGYPFRVGGLVVPGSVRREPNSLTIHFAVTDGAAEVPISYTGILPDLFREGQGIISVGQIKSDGSFEATEVLAKHDENYMPPEVADSLKQGGKIAPDYQAWRK